jgi:hypothetical protein
MLTMCMVVGIFFSSRSINPVVGVVVVIGDIAIIN